MENLICCKGEPFSLKERQERSHIRQRGQTLIEFVIALPVLLLMIYGIIEFGRMLYTYSALVTASSEAARWGSSTGPGASSPNRYLDKTGMLAAAQKAAPVITVNWSTKDNYPLYDLGPGTSPTSAPSSPVAADDQPRVIVELTTTFNPLVKWIGIPSITLYSKSVRPILVNISISN